VAFTAAERALVKAMAMARANSAAPIPARVGGPPVTSTGTPDPKETGAGVTSEDLGGPLNSACAHVIAPPASGRPRPPRPFTRWRPASRSKRRQVLNKDDDRIRLMSYASTGTCADRSRLSTSHWQLSA